MQYPVPNDYGDGGKGLSPKGAHGTPTLKDVLQELQKVAGNCVLFSLFEAREVDANGDVGNIVANGGVLASDTTPILRGAATTEAQEISWATGNTDPIAFNKSLPKGFDGTVALLVELWVSSGTTNPASFTVETSWDGGAGAAPVSDTADDTATKSATIHKITATIAAADIPDAPSFLSLMLTPAAHATDTIQLHAVRISLA